MKKLALETLNDSESAAAQRECALLRTLSHPHIVTYVSSYMSDAVLHIVMELCARGRAAGLKTAVSEGGTSAH